MEICSWHLEILRQVAKGERPTAGTPSWDVKDWGLTKYNQTTDTWELTPAGKSVLNSRKRPPTGK
jgi:hypothetical protein